jgi:hypothetical protein
MSKRNNETDKEKTMRKQLEINQSQQQKGRKNKKMMKQKKRIKEEAYPSAGVPASPVQAAPDRFRQSQNQSQT